MVPSHFVVLLVFAPPPEGKTYEQTTAELDSAIENFAGEDRQASIRALESALDLSSRYPDQALDDHTVSEVVLQGWIILSGLHLAEGDEVAAAEVMDQAIRLARGQTLPVRAYGPKVNELYEARKAALQAAGTATIEVDCKVDCQVVIGQRLLPERSEALFLGTYEVWVRASSGDFPWEYQQVELDIDGERIVYEDPAPKPMAPVGPSAPSPEPKRKRLLPELAGAALGVGLVIAGAVLLSYDGKCEISKERPTADTTFEQCGDIYETSRGGVALLGVGGGLLVISGVMLGIDEVRVGREKGRQATLGVSFRF